VRPAIDLVLQNDALYNKAAEPVSLFPTSARCLLHHARNTRYP
jgi:hypothetical protein